MSKNNIINKTFFLNNIINVERFPKDIPFEEVRKMFLTEIEPDLIDFFAHECSGGDIKFEGNLKNSYKWFYFISYACQALLEANYTHSKDYSFSDVSKFLLDDDFCEEVLNYTESQIAQNDFASDSSWRYLNERSRIEHIIPILRVLSKLGYKDII